MGYFFIYDVNETFVIEPLSLTGDIPTVTACTAIFSNSLVSCSGDTQIIMGDGTIIFDGDIQTSNIIGNTINGDTFNGATYYSGGTNLFDIIISTTTNQSITGGTFNGQTDTITLFKGNGNTIKISGLTDYYITGGTFNRASKLLTYTRNDGDNINVTLPVRTFLYNSGLTISNQSIIIDTITSIANNNNTFLVSYVTAYNNTNDYGFWKRTLALNKTSGVLKIIGENSDFDRISSGMTPNSVIYSANNGNLSIVVSGQTSKNYTWSSNWEIIN